MVPRGVQKPKSPGEPLLKLLPTTVTSLLCFCSYALFLFMQSSQPPLLNVARPPTRGGCAARRPISASVKQRGSSERTRALHPPATLTQPRVFNYLPIGRRDRIGSRNECWDRIKSPY
ncbi:hypothetical protein EVAR_4256_1 [Eumeta japonica]|uniref:Uncharacterized protein n=1 Tax=Eumeta variegata TaxID=151549 RepID=A0A4C1Z8Y7_EUMVA|nr:hypothetical protein EVAR_4256_1 [Eumeta japonica]